MSFRVTKSPIAQINIDTGGDTSALSGYLLNEIANVSGTLNNKIWASGSIVTAIANASGSAVTTASGVSIYLDGLLSGTLNTKIDTVSGYLYNFTNSGFYPNTGFKNPENITVTYSGATRCLYLTGTIDAYYHGQPVPWFSGGWCSEPHTATPTSDLYYYYNGVSGLWSTTMWPFDSIQVGGVAFGPTGYFFWGTKETHGMMPWECHEADHRTIGTYRESGGDFGSWVADSITAGDRRPTISACIIHDEDLEYTVPALTNDLYCQYYLVSADASGVVANDQTEIVQLTTSTPRYNQFNGSIWTQNEVTNNKYMCVWVVALPVTADTESQKRRYLFIQGQSEGTLAEQQALSSTSLNLTRLNALANEYVFIAKIIIYNLGGNWTITSIENLGGTRFSQTSTPAGTYLSTVTTDGTTLVGNGTASSPLGVSGIYALKTELVNASGTIMTRASGVSIYLDGLLSGTLVTAIANASGAAVITASGGAVTVANTNTTNVSGALKAQIWASGSIVTAISSASGAAVTNAVSQSTTILNNASGLFLKKDGTTPLTANWNAGNYVVSASGFTASGDINNNAAIPTIFLNSYSTTATDQSFLYLYRSHSGVIGSVVTTVDGDSLGTIAWRGVNATTWASAAKIIATQRGVVGTYIPTYLQFQTASASTLSTKMTITESGNVNIGASLSPNYKLTVEGAGVIGSTDNYLTDAAPLNIISKYIGTSYDIGAGDTLYIALCKTVTTTASYTGFDGKISTYRGSASIGNTNQTIDINIANAYNSIQVNKFIFSGSKGFQLVKGTWGGVEYIMLASTSAISNSDIFIDGMCRGMVPFLCYSADVSSVVFYQIGHMQLNTTSLTSLLGSGIVYGELTVGCGNLGHSPGDITARRSANTGAYYFGEAATDYIYFDSDHYHLGGAGISFYNDKSVRYEAGGFFRGEATYGHRFNDFNNTKNILIADNAGNVSFPSGSGFIGVSAPGSAWLSVHDSVGADAIHNMLRLSTTSTTAGAVCRMIMVNSSQPVNDGSAGKVFLDAIRTTNNMDFAISLHNVAATAPTERLRLTGEGYLVVGGNGTINNDGGLQPKFAVTNPSDDTKYIAAGYDNTADAGFIYCVDAGSAWKNLSLQPIAGNVGIGNTVPIEKLDVSGNIAANGLVLDIQDGYKWRLKPSGKILHIECYSGSAWLSAGYFGV